MSTIERFNCSIETCALSYSFFIIKGEIKGTAFNEDADRLYPIVELNKVTSTCVYTNVYIIVVVPSIGVSCISW